MAKQVLLQDARPWVMFRVSLCQGLRAKPVSRLFVFYTSVACVQYCNKACYYYNRALFCSGDIGDQVANLSEIWRKF